MKISDLLKVINNHVPFTTAESWDNVGLLIGDENAEITSILTGLDCTVDVVNEAIELGANTIICHHPLIFKGLKQINEQDGYGAIIRKIIQNNINLIAMHTNLDVYPKGVNAMLGEKLGLQNMRILNPEVITYYKVQVFIPEANLTDFKSKLSKYGLAQEGDYEYCFFQSQGTGQFKPVNGANPYLGTMNEIESVNEMKLEFMISEQQQQLAIDLINQYHPYETPVYDLIQLTREADYGLGMIGKLTQSYNVPDFVQHVKEQLNMPSVRFIGNNYSHIETVAIIGGSGIGYEYLAASKGADLFITGDIKHHDALDAKIAGVNLLDINHYSEYVMKEGLKALLINWLAEQDQTVKVNVSQINTDPFTYY